MLSSEPKRFLHRPPSSPVTFLQKLAQLITANVVCHPRILHDLLANLPNPPLISTTRLISLHYFHRSPPYAASFLHNTLIKSHSTTIYPEESIYCFIQMSRSGVSPDNFTYPFLLSALSHLRRRWLFEAVEGLGDQIHGQVAKRGFGSNIYVINTLLTFFAIDVEMGKARRLFDETFANGVVDVVTWNSIIHGYVKSGDLITAQNLFDEMPWKSDVSFSTMISAYTSTLDLDRAQFLIDSAEEGNVVTWNTMLTGLSKHGKMSSARKLFDKMPIKTIVSWNALVSGYAANGEMSLAMELFEMMPERDVVSWTAMISGYHRSSRYVEALEFFKSMLIDGTVKPTDATLIVVLSGCANLANLTLGRWVHAYIDRSNLLVSELRSSGTHLTPALIDMYSKCGETETALKLFYGISVKSVSAWNAMITGLAINGHGRESVDLFTEMQISGPKPNDITLVGVLTGCSHSGLINDGRRIFKSLTLGVYGGVTPELKHYGCYIDMLSRSGHLREAAHVISLMQMEPDFIILNALLASCKTYGNSEIARKFQSKFIELSSEPAVPEESKVGGRILVSKIYAGDGEWEKEEHMRAGLRRKQVGWSSIEKDGTVHRFIAGDRSHRQTHAIYSWVDEMVVKLRSEEGYNAAAAEGDVLVDLCEEDRESWGARHSEKLALGFAMLLDGGSGDIVKIVKNLRMCRDCHIFFKHVSKASKKVILVRDRIRFHRFVNGVCSCRDFW
ncbi:Pentatricopeptide repeat-containing protein [Zostera marina]|uniref:Pentatricopeptide repeat-containing protein n=1 Tax=Zostera marina TaxID=29655 RepID=A0A0K9Q166_ZOSMR|nr:Pentatricopeptide repeat-containing protein [Zostera marina]